MLSVHDRQSSPSRHHSIQQGPSSWLPQLWAPDLEWYWGIEGCEAWCSSELSLGCLKIERHVGQQALHIYRAVSLLLDEGVNLRETRRAYLPYIHVAHHQQVNRALRVLKLCPTSGCTLASILQSEFTHFLIYISPVREGDGTSHAVTKYLNSEQLRGITKIFNWGMAPYRGFQTR